MNTLFSVEGKIAIVTGAAKGIGFGIAKGLAEAGAKIVLCDCDEYALDKAQAMIKEVSKAEVLKIVCDVRKPESVRNVVDTTYKSFARIDILVNNAGINVKRFFWEATIEDWNAMVDINLRGQFLFAKEVAPIMMEQRYGKIINLASMVSFGATEMNAIYIATKGGVMQMTKAMAVDLAPYGVYVNALAPGYIDTGLFTDEEVKNRTLRGILDMQLMKRVATPEDLVGPAIFLASDASNHVCGTSILVDGGVTSILYRLQD